MKFLFVSFLAVACFVNFSEEYLCYECNSTYDKNCFDFSPQFSYYKGVYCDENGSGDYNCYSVHISDRKQRKLYRGCGKKGICDEYERKDETSIQMKVLTCDECNEHYCNDSADLSPPFYVAILKTYLTLFISTVVKKLFV